MKPPPTDVECMVSPQILCVSLSLPPVLDALRQSPDIEVRWIESLVALEDDDSPIVLAPNVDDAPGLSALPLLSHRAVIAIVPDADAAAALDAGAIDVVSPDGRLEDLVRALALAPHRSSQVRQLKTRVQDLRSAIHSLPVGIAVVEGDTLVYVNETMDKLVPNGAQQLGEPMRALFDKRDRALWDASDRPVELRLADSPETLVIISELSMLQTRDGPLSLFAVRDITQERALEARLHRAERVASLRSTALEIAHEINNPLAVLTHDLPELRGLLQVAPGDEDLAVAHEILGEMSAASDRIAHAIVKLRNAADGVTTTELGRALDAARASANIPSQVEVSFLPIASTVAHTRIALDAAVFVPLLSSTLNLTSHFGRELEVQAEYTGDEVHLIIDADQGLGLYGDLSPRRLHDIDLAVAEELSVRMSIARRAGVRLVVVARGDRVRYVLSLPRTMDQPRRTRSGRFSIADVSSNTGAEGS